MKGSIWIYSKSKDGIRFFFQVDGIKRGNYTKTINPTFKGWKEVSTGYNYKNATETLIFSKPFSSDEEMINWVKHTVEFPTVYNKSDAKNTIKVLVADKNEVKNASAKRATKAPVAESGTVRKSKKATHV